MLYRANFLLDVQPVPDLQGVVPDYYLIVWPTGQHDQISVKDFQSPLFSQLFKIAETTEKEPCSRNSLQN